MKNIIFVLILISYCGLSFGHESACERTQHVIAKSGTQDLDQWIVTEPTIHSVNLPNGFELGVQISPPMEKYSSDFYPNGGTGVEIVELVVFDMSAEPPKRLHRSYAGANSIQGPNLRKFGAPEYSLTLLRPVCVAYEAPST